MSQPKSQSIALNQPKSQVLALGDVNHIIEQMKNSALFKGVKPEELEAMVKIMKSKDYPAGEMIFEKGQTGDRMFIVTSGKVRIFTRDGQGNEIVLAHHTPVQMFGHFSLLDQQPRSAWGITDFESTLLVLTREEFFAFLPTHSSVGLAMIRNLADHVRQVTSFLTSVNASVEKLSAGDYDRAIQEISSSGAEAEVGRLVEDFIKMVHSVREREERLKKK